jgi:hypothetical protein
VAVVVFRPTLRIVHVLVGMALFLLLYLPYVAYEIAHGFENVRGLLGFAASEQGGNGLRALASVSRTLLLLFLPALGGFIVEGEWSRTFLGGFRLLYATKLSCLPLDWRSACPACSPAGDAALSTRSHDGGRPCSCSCG